MSLRWRCDVSCEVAAKSLRWQLHLHLWIAMSLRWQRDVRLTPHGVDLRTAGVTHQMAFQLTEAEAAARPATVRRQVGSGLGMPRKRPAAASSGAKRSRAERARRRTPAAAASADGGADDDERPHGELWAEVTLLGASRPRVSDARLHGGEPQPAL
jgi:hypothetical protein